MEHKGTKILYTDRLILRPFTYDDIQSSYNNWTNDIVTCKYLTWKPHETLELTSKIIGSWIDQYNDLSFYQWAIEYNKEVIGTISIVRLDEVLNKVEVGYCIGSKYYRQGIVSEALNRIIKYFFEEININKFSAKCNNMNIGSYKVMEKCNLKLEGILKEEDYSNAGIGDLRVYGMTREDYFIKDGLEYIDEVKDLILEYNKELDRDLSFQNIDEELKDLSKYKYPNGEILAYMKDNEVIGIVAYYKHNDYRCEMKRLYVKKEYRNKHIGRILIQSILRHAQKAGYKEMVLDTIIPLQTALHLYKKYDFKECEAYYNNPMDDVIYMIKQL